MLSRLGRLREVSSLEGSAAMAKPKRLVKIREDTILDDYDSY